MHSYNLDNKYRYYSKTITKGTQEKFYKDNYYYKINKCGNEGFTEYLISRLLKHSSLSDNSFVDYEYCKINGVYGCRSKSFLYDSSEEFVSINSIYIRLTGDYDLADKLATFSNAQERLSFVLSIIDSFGFSVNLYRQYLNILVQLDLLICNTDRHVHNYGIIYNRLTNMFRLAPIFDNGLSLGTDRDKHPSSCTLSGSFTDQVIAFGYPIQPTFKLNYTELYRDLSRIEKLYGKHSEVDNLRINLARYKSIFSI